MKWDKIALFLGGVLFGTAGVKILSSEGCQESLHPCDSGSASCKRVCYDYSNYSQGKC